MPQYPVNKTLKPYFFPAIKYQPGHVPMTNPPSPAPAVPSSLSNFNQNSAIHSANPSIPLTESGQNQPPAPLSSPPSPSLSNINFKCHIFVDNSGTRLISDMKNKLYFYYDLIMSADVWYPSFAGTIDGQRKAFKTLGVLLKHRLQKEDIKNIVYASECKKHLFPKMAMYNQYKNQTSVFENLYPDIENNHNINFQKYLKDLDDYITTHFKNK